MNSVLDDFIEEARGVSIKDAAERLKLAFSPKGDEHAQPCPVSGGTDRFSFNTSKNNWICRHCDVGGRDAIGMAAHCLELDLKDQAGFLEACKAVTGRDIPEGGERETDEARAERLARIEAQRRRNAEAEAKRAEDQAGFREKERNKARGIYQGGGVLALSSATFGYHYLTNRGCGVPDDRWLRLSAEVPYWHGQDGRGRPVEIYSGPAMIAPFIDPAGEIVGCHITWIDLQRPPKFRPLLTDPDTGEVLPTKKMRGTKKGGIIPLCGQPLAQRWLGAEGIENTLAFGRFERFRADTFYFAAGDLGNMAGPADPKSRFAHPSLKKPDKNGRERPLSVAGPVPLVRETSNPDAMVVPGHVDELVLLADGDSERVMTAAAMARARARHARVGRRIPVVWPRPGTDWAGLLAGTAFEKDGVSA